MENNSQPNTRVSFVKVDEDKIINENCIRWVKKMGDCLEICTRTEGCSYLTTHKLCKLNDRESYDKLNKHFEKNDY